MLRNENPNIITWTKTNYQHTFPSNHEPSRFCNIINCEFYSIFVHLYFVFVLTPELTLVIYRFSWLPVLMVLQHFSIQCTGERANFLSEQPFAGILLTGFSLGLNDRALRCFIQRPVVLFNALSFYSTPCRFSSAPCRFFSALSFSESPLVSLGFHQRYFELEVAESVQLRRKVARFLCITLFIVIRVGHRRHLGFTMNINLCKLVRPVVFQDQLEPCTDINAAYVFAFPGNTCLCQ